MTRTSVDKTFTPEAWWTDETLRDWIERADRETPARTALVGPTSQMTYAELNTRVLALANVLRDLGLGRGDVIAAQLPNIAEFVLIYLASGHIGAILQTVHMPYRGAEIEPLLRFSGAKAFVCVTAVKDYRPADFALSLRERTQLRHVIAVGADPPEDAIAFPSTDGSGRGPFERVPASETFLLLFTSGTVAAPKGVPVPYRKLLN